MFAKIHAAFLLGRSRHRSAAHGPTRSGTNPGWPPEATLLWIGYGIHGTNEPGLLGQAVSHGCVRMLNQDIEALYPLVAIGTPVNIIGQIFTGRMLFPGRSTGPDVRAVQELLGILGYYRGDADGIYGPATADAVRRFQAAQRLTPDGIVGPQTYDALLEAFDVERGSVAP